MKGLFKVYINKNDYALKLEGDVLEKKSNSVYLNYNCYAHELVKLEDDKLIVKSTNQNKIPLFYHINDKEIIITNHLITDESACQSINYKHLAAKIAGYKKIYGTIFNEQSVLLPSLIYIFDQNKDDFIFSEPTMKYSPTSSDGVFTLIESKFDEFCSVNKNIYLFMSAGFDSRLDLAFLLNAQKKHNNQITLMYIKDDYESARYVKKIAKRFNLECLFFENDKLHNEFDFYKHAYYLSTDSKIAINRFLSLADFIRKSDPTAIFVGNGVGSLKGRYYLKTFDQIYKNKIPKINTLERVCSYFNFDNSEIEAIKNDFKNDFEWLKNHTGSNDETFIKDMMYTNSGDRMLPMIALYDSAYIINDDDVYQGFASLPLEEKREVNFIMYCLNRLNPTLAEMPFVTGDMPEVDITASQKIERFIYNNIIAKMLNISSYKKSYEKMIKNPEEISIKNERIKRAFQGILESDINIKVKINLSQITDYIMFLNQVQGHDF